MIDQQNMKVKNGSTWHTICPFPVGFIYLAATSTSPGTTFGGTWVALTSGYFLRPAGTFSGTGGESSHTLTVGEMPSHSHKWDANLVWTESNNRGPAISDSRYDSAWWYVWSSNDSTSSVGGSAAHNNLPPYQNVFGWRRTA